MRRLKKFIEIKDPICFIPQAFYARTFGRMPNFVVRYGVIQTVSPIYKIRNSYIASLYVIRFEYDGIVFVDPCGYFTRKAPADLLKIISSISFFIRRDPA